MLSLLLCGCSSAPKKLQVPEETTLAPEVTAKIETISDARFGKIAAAVSETRAKIEAEQLETAKKIKAKDERIAALTADVERVKRDAAANIWTMTGAGLVVVGGLVCAFVSARAGIPIVACGAFAGALPLFFDSPYFTVIAGVSLAVCSGLCLWWFYDRVSDSVHESDGKDS